ncbi:ATP-binding cassette domain-containing protein [Dolosigranulum savutiense]|uniref:ATP-binding cassette domain-containing protein n=1 Tax=Dolosigranulum savutiense TaxID=3110288 RepID=A0AB74TRJ9_9LACT
MIELNNVSKMFGKKQVIQNVSLPIEKGKLTACIGPNGAGKSTLLEMISRLMPHDGGSITIDGHDVKTYKQEELAKRLSVLKQSNHLNVRLTVRELVAFGRFPYTKGRLNSHCHRIIDQSLSYLGMEELQNRYIDTLSGGQLQRALIAMVLCQDTDYILLDEPLNNLDMNFGVKMMQTIRQLVDELHKTIVTVVHDVNFAAAYADNIIAMKDGQLFRAGSVDDIMQKAVLDELFEMDIQVVENDGKKFIMYY